MGANRVRKLSALILSLAIAGTAAVLLTRSPDAGSFSVEDEKFTVVFVEMALAREMVGNDLDSLRILYDEIFQRNEVDSLWILNYITDISNDTEKHKLIWDVIVEKLDSIKNSATPDSTTD
jgi:hypothetical protein